MDKLPRDLSPCMVLGPKNLDEGYYFKNLVLCKKTEGFVWTKMGYKIPVELSVDRQSIEKVMKNIEELLPYVTSAQLNFKAPDIALCEIDVQNGNFSVEIDMVE